MQNTTRFVPPPVPGSMFRLALLAFALIVAAVAHAHAPTSALSRFFFLWTCLTLPRTQPSCACTGSARPLTLADSPKECAF